MKEYASPVEIETLAVSLYESDCRTRARELAKKSTLSHVRTYLGFPSWASAPAATRDAYREKALRMISECERWVEDQRMGNGK